MPRPADPQRALRRTGASLLRFPELTKATHADFGKPETAIFVHGFTADASYMHDLMHQFAGNGWVPIAFEYPSDRGIHQAARVLREMLEVLDHQSAVSRDRVVLVCHSMGGLVGRALIALEGGSLYVRKLITLGTPHDGTLRTALALRFVLRWGEHVSGLNPKAFKPSAQSAKELIQKDPSPTLLSRLQATAPTGKPVEFHSISGGLNKLEFGTGPSRDKLANIYLQWNLSHPNDGLVQETSADLSGKAFNVCAPGCRHLNSYTEYPNTNHSYLVRNQLVALRVVACAR